VPIAQKGPIGAGHQTTIEKSNLKPPGELRRTKLSKWLPAVIKI